MRKKLIIAWICVSFGGMLLGYLWAYLDPENTDVVLLYLTGQMSSLLAVGYYITPSNAYGKIAFVFVAVMTAGITFKILHLPGANGMIYTGLLGIFITYGVMWFANRKTNEE